MKLNAELVTKTSKDGKPYTCILVHLAPNYDKVVFLTNAEIELIKVVYGK